MPGGVSMLLRLGLAGVARRMAAAGGLLRVAAVRIAGALVGGMPLRVPGIVIVTAGVVAAGVVPDAAVIVTVRMLGASPVGVLMVMASRRRSATAVVPGSRARGGARPRAGAAAVARRANDHDRGCASAAPDATATSAAGRRWLRVAVSARRRAEMRGVDLHDGVQ